MNEMSNMAGILIRQIQDSLNSGGIGVKELARLTNPSLIDGSPVNLYPSDKKAAKGMAYVDILATRESPFLDTECILVQVKHHKGTTSITGIKQLHKYDPSDEYICSRKILITTAKLSPEVRSKAEDLDILTIDGTELVDWIYENIDQLSASTRAKIGVSMPPTLV